MINVGGPLNLIKAGKIDEMMMDSKTQTVGIYFVTLRTFWKSLRS